MSALPPTSQVPEAAPTRVDPGPVRRWILSHDDSWLFTLSYVGLAVALSIWISLFWLLAVVGVHFAFEWIRQTHLSQGQQPISGAVLWEVKLDLALVIFALALAAYMEVILGLAGLGGAARLAQAGARSAGWTRAFRGILLSVDDAAHVARAVAHRSRGGTGAESRARRTSPAPPSVRDWKGQWSFGDHFAVWFGSACLLLLLAAPWLTHHNLTSLITTVSMELHPWPR